MSSELSVRARQLTKRYRVRRDAELSQRRRRQWDVFTALEGIDLDVRRGDVLGLIGHNGSGKSTFLKLVCGITSPTAGELDRWGRVGSLLEVGTGFHGELTGRENVYLNGSILGMRTSEIDAKFDNIVDFADIGPVLDTPVKRYSSGMQVRLAFAVAAHLNPEIMVVDEVLAVGDADFQARCLGKMHDVSSGEGRTVLFVSHNMASIEHLCSRVVILNRGKIVFDGEPGEAIRRYLASPASDAGDRDIGVFDHDGVYVDRVALTDGAWPLDKVRTGQPLSLIIDLKNIADVRKPIIGVSVFTRSGQKVFAVHTHMKPLSWGPRNPDGFERVEVHMPDLPLLPGQYEVVLSLKDQNGGTTLEHISRAAVIDVVGGSNVFGTGYALAAGEGLVYVDHEWSQHAVDWRTTRR